MKDFKMPASGCPECGHVMDGATNVTGSGAPTAGDFSVCIRCASILQFTPMFTLEKATPDALRKLLAEQPEDFRALIHIKALLHRARGKQRRRRHTWN